MKIRTYQNSLAVLFALTWGVVILDRNAITHLYPILMEQFGWNNTQTGQIAMVTGFGFVISSLFLTAMADKSGLKKIWLVPLIILAGVFSGSTAFAGSLMFMLIVRFLTGFADGPIYPLMTSVLMVQGDPKRFATYIGIIQFSVGLIAGVLAPVLTVKLAIYLNWQYAFIFTSLPAVIIGLIIWFVLKDVRPPSSVGHRPSNPESAGHMAMQWKDVPGIFAYRNCTLSYIANILIMIGFWGVVTFGTTYWNHEGGLTLENAAWLGTAAGIVGLVWAIVIPFILDRLGRKLSASIFTVYIALSMFVMYVDKGIIGQTAFVLVIGCCGFVSVLFVAIICQESVPPAIAATTTAIGMALGEFFGTSLGPQALGALGDWYELRIIFLVGGICAVFAFFITLALTETRKPHINGNPRG